MSSKTEIVNMALAEFGHDGQLVDVDSDATAAAIYARLFFDQVRDAVLRDHPWNFAHARASIAAMDTAPAFGFSYQYALPVDPWCLRALREEDDEIKFKVEGRRILTDKGAPFRLHYTSRVADTGLWDPLFVDAFTARLAMPLSKKLGVDDERDALEKLYMRRLAAAQQVDGQEGALDEHDDEDFFSARY